MAQHEDQDIPIRIAGRGAGDLDEPGELARVETQGALLMVPADRSHLLQRLIAGLDRDLEVEDAWTQVADHREAELESSSMTDTPGPEAVARLRATLV